MNEETLQKLITTYHDNKADIELLQQHLLTIEDHITQELMAEKLEKAQQIVNRLYTQKQDPILIDVQVEINELRYKYDITDPREIINYDNGKGFVQ
ncbi:hypothetical protein PXD04_10450 [Methanosphaera sp. ISO3-F5]|uniref:hypothetical protein n=1 Tax=Methanosphaera sp. ISO3-F5 TaxID=1452353 RepID=UPI002B262868|nr:hypothetical protein [Methanosphaera sp. ISO3-F5]WQH64111.1 hypothetical protein PXD04_10450 [Methanosphaera sp. ISO3-F5]